MTCLDVIRAELLAVGSNNDNIFKGDITLGPGWWSGEVAGVDATGYTAEVEIDRNTIYFDLRALNAAVCGYATLTEIPPRDKDLWTQLQQEEERCRCPVRNEGKEITAMITAEFGGRPCDVLNVPRLLPAYRSF